MAITDFNALQRETVAACFDALATAEVTYKRRTVTGPANQATGKPTESFTTVETTVSLDRERSDELAGGGGGGGAGDGGAGEPHVFERAYLVRVDLETDREAEGWLFARPKAGDQLVIKAGGAGGASALTLKVARAERAESVYSWRVYCRST